MSALVTKMQKIAKGVRQKMNRVEGDDISEARANKRNASPSRYSSAPANNDDDDDYNNNDAAVAKERSVLGHQFAKIKNMTRKFTK